MQRHDASEIKAERYDPNLQTAQPDVLADPGYNHRLFIKIIKIMTVNPNSALSGSTNVPPVNDRFQEVHELLYLC